MWSNDKYGAKGFLTPQPPAWNKSNSMAPMSERKTLLSLSPHVIHKVPPSDSPYGRAKHVQLIDKDPSKAISLFWAAINAGDRVDSALKDMAVVMKQLNRSDEAIEAIKSFRHLCPPHSQESLDNVLVELYKRSGRVEEEIEILQTKLKKIDQGTVFGGKRTKIARSQGKKIQMTIEQEKSRILGNLAWAYLQQHNYGIAERHYRKALLLEPDKNKQCNLAICLMHMNRLSEAKLLLEDVKASSGNEEMDESYSKSYERAVEMLLQSEPAADKGSWDGRRSLKEASFFLPRNEDNIPYTTHWQGKMVSDVQCTPNGGKSPCEGPMSVNSTGSAHKKIYANSAASRKTSEALFTQPRRCLWSFNSADKRRVRRNTVRKLSFEQTENMVEEEEPKASSCATGQEEEQVLLFTQPRNSLSWLNNRKVRWGEESIGKKLSFVTSVVSHSTENLNVQQPVDSLANATVKKSWADMVEEEEEEFNDENLNANITCGSSLDMKGASEKRRNRLQVFQDITSP
ncbi:hypothetical protein PTKIN_Ptkin18bG0016000 [Pterospermum kingtungense]